MLNIDRKIHFYLIIVTLQLCSYVYAKFPHEGILNNEVHILILIIISHSVCYLLIVNSPDLIIVLVYRPPSSPFSDLLTLLLKAIKCIASLLVPLPNIVLIGDVKMPEGFP